MRAPRILREFLDRPVWSVALHVLPFLIVAAFPLIHDLGKPVPLWANARFPLGNVLQLVMVYSVLTLGLNVVLGYTGLLDLGYVTFIATGAWLTSLFLGALPNPDPSVFVGDRLQFDGGYLIVLLACGCVCAVLGVLRGLPTLRLTGDFYAIVTLGIAEILYFVLKNEDAWTGGAHTIALPIPSLFGRKLYWDAPVFYYLALAVLLATVYVMYRLQNSRVGRAWAAIRLDETAARACGIHVGRYRMIAFATSGFFGGIGGSLFMVSLGTLAVANLDIWQSIMVLAAVVLGGTGSIRGVLLGTLILFSLGEVLRPNVVGNAIPPESRFLVYGLLLIFLMRFRPQGILPRVAGEKEPNRGEEERMVKEETRLFVFQTVRGAEAAAPILDLSGVSRHFGGLKAVENVSLAIAAGQITSLIGPNGAGKTTLFNSITGIFPPTAGSVRFKASSSHEAVEIGRTSPATICQLGIARTFQNIRLFSDLPVLENVKVGLHCRTRANVFGAVLTLPAANREEAETNKAALHYLDFVGLFDKANDVAVNLAYGDQRRLEIARALATQPRLLLLDEPAAGMNPQEKVRLMALIRKIRQAGTTVLLIEHDMKLVMEVSDTIYVLDHGELISHGSPAVVSADPKVVEAYLGMPEGPAETAS